MDLSNERPNADSDYERPAEAARSHSYPPASAVRRWPLAGATIAEAIQAVCDEVFEQEASYRGVAPQTQRDNQA